MNTIIDAFTIATFMVALSSLSLSIWNTVTGLHREKAFQKTFLDPARRVMEEINTEEAQS